MAELATVLKVEIVNLSRFERAIDRFLKGTAKLKDVRKAAAALRIVERARTRKHRVQT